MTMAATSPALFVSHGSPLIALGEHPIGRALAAFAVETPSPRGIVVLSAHWSAPTPVRVTSSPTSRILHDFIGFPRALLAMEYGCPGDPVLAAEVARLLEDGGVSASMDPDRGLDHGAWIPLRLAYPEARVPVVQISLPRTSAPILVRRMGAALAPLRRTSVLLVGSGGIVHNLRLARLAAADGPVDGWARSFDEWIRERVGLRDHGGIAAFRQVAPHAGLAAPTSEHLDPIHFVLGAELPGDRIQDVYQGFQHGNVSLRSFAMVA